MGLYMPRGWEPMAGTRAGRQRQRGRLFLVEDGADCVGGRLPLPNWLRAGAVQLSRARMVGGNVTARPYYKYRTVL